MGEGKSSFEKKKEKKIKTAIEIIFPKNFLPLRSIRGESHMNSYQGSRNRPRKKSLDHVHVIPSSEVLCFADKKTVSIPASYG